MNEIQIITDQKRISEEMAFIKTIEAICDECGIEECEYYDHSELCPKIKAVIKE